MKTLVLDASVGVKWVLTGDEETLKLEAFGLLDRYGAGEIDFIVPDIFWAECGNILWKAVLRGRHSHEDAELAIASMKRRNFPTTPSVGLLQQALGLALEFNRTVYDSLYVALAIQSKTEMITADERLANALAARLPVKWLGAF